MKIKSASAVFILSLTMDSSVTGAVPDRYLNCDLQGTSIVLGYNLEPIKIFDVRYPAVHFSDIGATATHLTFTVNNVFYALDYAHGWDNKQESEKAYSMGGIINRITGEAKMTFYAEHTPSSIAKCYSGGGGPWCDYPKVVHTIVGICKPTQRKF